MRRETPLNRLMLQTFAPAVLNELAFDDRGDGFVSASGLSLAALTETRPIVIQDEGGPKLSQHSKTTAISSAAARVHGLKI
jgi:hypothetical protein